MIDTMQDSWTQLVFLFGVIAWAVRLESRATQNSKDLARLELRLADQRREDLETRARDWGRMEVSISDIQKDIKKLSERPGI